MNANLHNPNLNGEPFFWKAGPVGVLLLHGFTATPVEVRSAAEILHAQGYSVAGPLLPGHGTTPDDLNRVHWQDWVDAAEDAYRQLKECCSSVFVGGESMGGVAALYLATLHPEAAGVLAYSPAVKLRLTLLKQLELRAAALVKPSIPKGSLDASDHWQGYTVNPLKGSLQLLDFERALIGRLHLIRQPVVVFQGRFDTTIDPTCGEIILQGVSSTVKELHWMEQSSHVILIDRELVPVMQMTEKFIQKVMETE